MYIADSRATTKHFFFPQEVQLPCCKGTQVCLGRGHPQVGLAREEPSHLGLKGGGEGTDVGTEGVRQTHGEGERRGPYVGRVPAGAVVQVGQGLQPGALPLLPLALLSCGRSLGWTQWWPEGREPLTCPVWAHGRMGKCGAGKFQERHRW